MTAPWTSLPQAAALLASIADRPPPMKGFKYAFDEWDVRYADARVTRLRRIHEAEAARLLKRADAGDREPYERHMSFDHQQAIRDAIAHRGQLGRAA